MTAREEASLLERAFAAGAAVLGDTVLMNEAVEVRCDEAAGADRYRAERSAELEVTDAAVAGLAGQLAASWRDLGYTVEELTGDTSADFAVFAEQGAVRVSAVVGDLGAGRALMGIAGSTGCHGV